MKTDNPETTEAEWAARLAALREDEWRTRCRLQELAQEIIKRIKVEEQKITASAAVDLFESASKFGRMAVEGIEEPPKGEEAQVQWMADLHQALDALYQPLAATPPPAPPHNINDAPPA